jgi:hypothetical protein
MERYKNLNSTIHHAALCQTHQPAAHHTPRAPSWTLDNSLSNA